jgi:hypothetical protein
MEAVLLAKECIAGIRDQLLENLLLGGYRFLAPPALLVHHPSSHGFAK